ncbi:hypothetical protein KY290_025486 [Solanum tuberosum]|uniref:Retrovirus-related Pol polyprotein from transposon TNT 1-94-like beta-barrel domain-containing protein n=1 Tax=Solanum tuberosum TaxID=4113 RepID=A0ABQ7UTQ0_SOLTU|nr:hypothetical protein KY290_025486 [Solanum tuberosum]
MVTPSTSVFAADNTTHLVQFNPGSQLPIKLMGPSNFVIWKAQVESFMLGHDLYGYLRWNHDSVVQDCPRECFRAKAHYALMPWIVDSGASHHVTTDSQQLDSSKDYTETVQITIGNGNKIPVTHTGFEHRGSVGTRPE